MAFVKLEFFLLLMVSYQLIVLGQRPSFAGSRPPNGYKDRFRPKPTDNEVTPAPAEGLANRLGIDGTQKPPQGVPVVYGEPVSDPVLIVNRIQEDQTTSAPIPSRLPYDAHGDATLVEILSRLPPDQRPFWFINYQAIEAHRNSTPTSNFNTIASRSSFLGK